jgi:hypothetical protein
MSSTDWEIGGTTAAAAAASIFSFGSAAPEAGDAAATADAGILGSDAGAAISTDRVSANLD